MCVGVPYLVGCDLVTKVRLEILIAEGQRVVLDDHTVSQCAGEIPRRFETNARDLRENLEPNRDAAMQNNVDIIEPACIRSVTCSVAAWMRSLNRSAGVQLDSASSTSRLFPSRAAAVNRYD